MSLRKQEWLQRLAYEGRLYQTIASKEFLIKKAQKLGLGSNSAETLSQALLEKTYRPLGGNEVDLILLDVVLELVEAVIKQCTGDDLKQAFKQGYKIQSVDKIDLKSYQTEIFSLLPMKFKEEAIRDLIWKATKLDAGKVLLLLAPLLKKPTELIRAGERLSLTKEERAFQADTVFEFGGYAIKGENIIPAKSSLENFKSQIKKLTGRSMTGYSVGYVAKAIRNEVYLWHLNYGSFTDRRLGRYLDSYIRERVYLFLLKKYDKAGKKEVYQRFMLGYPTLEGITIPSVRPVGEPCAGKLACTVRGADK